MVNVCAAVHPFASVTVQVHVPAVKPVTLAVPSPVGLPGVQLYEYAVVPPETVTLAAPLLPALHDTFVCEATATASAAAG